MDEIGQLAQSGRMAAIVDAIRRAPGEVMALPPTERRIAELAIDGHDVHSIASHVGMAEGAVWELLENLARTISGSLPERPREVAGMGADLDPGVTGGYGETGFGDIGNEPPEPVTEEGEELKKEEGI